jgi:serine/threonine protein kinase
MTTSHHCDNDFTPLLAHTQQILLTADPGALSILKGLLAFDPVNRPTAEEALAHPYFRGGFEVAPFPLLVLTEHS